MQKLSRQGFADEVNRRIRAHLSYRQGNRIRLFPDGTTEDKARGYAYDYWGDNATSEQSAMFSEVEAQVRAEFDVENYASWGSRR